MGVIQPSPPELVEELARSSLLHLSRPASGKPSAALQRAERSAGVAEPVQVFYMGLRPMAGDASLAAAEAIAWRFFVLSGGRALAATEIALNRSRPSPSRTTPPTPAASSSNPAPKPSAWRLPPTSAT